jgi:hypothetical protein
MKKSDYLKFENFADDVTVEIACVETDHLEGLLYLDNSISIPEKLWNRILFLGKAYQLHFSEVVQPFKDTIFNSKQCEYLKEELYFLMSIIKDDAAIVSINIVLSEISKVKNNSKLCLVISPP